MPTQLERLKTKKDEIEKKIKQMKTKELEKGKKYIEKKRQIIGDFFLDKHKDKTNELKRMLDPFLKKVRDRKLFGLKPKEKKETPTPTSDSTNLSKSNTPYWKN